jgi:protocatechuate 3,4-dioxygenase beta subunit
MVRPERVVQSAPDGSFVLSNVARGMKKVVARKEGFATDGIYPVNLMAQRQAEGLTLVLASGQSISGRVVDAQTLEPVAGAIVTARPVAEHRPGAPSGGESRNPRGAGVREGDRWRRSNGDGGPVPDEESALSPPGQPPHPRFNKRGFLVQTARSDEDGNYVIAGLTLGRYAMTSLRKGYQPLVGVSATAGSGDVVLRLQPSARFSGKVIDDVTGEPVTRFTLAVSSRDDPVFFPAAGRQRFESESGEFEYIDVRPGKAALLARAEGYAGGGTELFSVTNGQQIGGVVIRMIKGATIGGLVTDRDGRPVSKAKIHLEPEERGGAAANPLIEILSRQLLGSARSATTDGDGRWTMPNVFEAEYRVRAEHADYSPEKSAVFRSPLAGEFEVETLVMRAGGIIRGIVRTESGEPDTKAMVMVRSVDSSQMMSRSAQTDASGRYEVGGLEPGSYYIVVTQREGVPNPFEILVAAQKGKAVSVSEGRVTNIDL